MPYSKDLRKLGWTSSIIHILASFHNTISWYLPLARPKHGLDKLPLDDRWQVLQSLWEQITQEKELVQIYFSMSVQTLWLSGLQYFSRHDKHQRNALRICPVLSDKKKASAGGRSGNLAFTLCVFQAWIYRCCKYESSWTVIKPSLDPAVATPAPLVSTSTCSHCNWGKAAARTFVVIVDESKLCDGPRALKLGWISLKCGCWSKHDRVIQMS